MMNSCRLEISSWHLAVDFKMSQSQTESAIYSSRHYIHQHTLHRYLLAWFEPLYQISIFPYGPLPNQVRVNNIHPCDCTFVCSRYHRQPGSESTGKPRAANLDSGKWHHQIEPMFASGKHASGNTDPQECQIGCQNVCHIDSHKKCQVECQAVCQMKSQTKCQIEYQIECQREYQNNQIQSQNIWQMECQKECPIESQYIYIYIIYIYNIYVYICQLECQLTGATRGK